jgi:hypothetical protein
MTFQLMSAKPNYINKFKDAEITPDVGIDSHQLATNASRHSRDQIRVTLGQKYGSDAVPTDSLPNHEDTR